jgi:hypothetical protein
LLLIEIAHLSRLEFQGVELRTQVELWRRRAGRFAAGAAHFFGARLTAALSAGLITALLSVALLAAALSITTLTAALFHALPTAAAASTDNPPDDAVGTIEGEAIALQGPMTVEVVHGQVKTVLRSGNDIRVKTGQARMELVEGGKIAICGPAHLSVLKSGGSLTVALDSGVIRVHIDKQPAITIYTAQIQAKPMSIGEGPEDALIGFDAPGVMCVRATSGAIRLEQQLTGQSVIVPQGGDILLNNGALEGLQNTAGHCACEMQWAKNDAPPPEISRIATTEEIRQRDEEAKKASPAPTPAPAPEKTATAEKAPASEKPADAERQPVTAENAPADKSPAEKSSTPKQEPIYQVFMPPLAYDAHAAVQVENFDPKLIVLVRRVRVRPTLIFQGRVEGDAAVQSVAAVKPAGAKAATPAPATQSPVPRPKDDSVVNRVRAFLRNLFS